MDGTCAFFSEVQKIRRGMIADQANFTLEARNFLVASFRPTLLCHCRSPIEILILGRFLKKNKYRTEPVRWDQNAGSQFLGATSVHSPFLRITLVVRQADGGRSPASSSPFLSRYFGDSTLSCRTSSLSQTGSQA